MAEGQGDARGYSWEPFEDGNEKSLTHGAGSERRVAPLAAEIEQAARSDPSWPSFLDGSQYGSAVAAWARAEAIVALLWRWLDARAEQGVEELLTERSHEQSDETRAKGRSQRVTTGRRVASVLEMLRRFETLAANHRSKLGLDPLSRAKFGKDLAIGTAVAGQLDRLHETGAQLVQRYGTPAALTGQSHHPDGVDPSTAISGGSNDVEG